ncbi:MAG: 2-oxoglutarate dehydrogenase E1 component [Pseudomonadota bacterium]|nr:MAG: 2-oxoglutarate dehydrogenase E1 component [Pseudomonadota bacterium]
MDDKVKGFKTLQERHAASFLAGANAPYVEALYERFLEDPNSVESRWRSFFETLPRVDGVVTDVAHSNVRDAFRHLARAPRTAVAVPGAPVATDADHARKQVRVLQLINAYRFRGHQIANFEPLGIREIPEAPDLQLAYHGFTEADLETVFETGSLAGPERATLREIVEILAQTYCRCVGAEYMHITNTDEKRWLQDRLERDHCNPEYSLDTKRRLLERSMAAEALENYLHTRYVGQKRFSIEGAESLIPLLDELIQRGGEHGLQELVIGMAHRGRINVLTHIMGKMPSDLFMEFEGKHDGGNGSGDVKYHMGFSSNVGTRREPVHVALAFNPSHLEIVGPVIQGSVRARQERRGDRHGSEVMAVLIHGDAAFAGQGVVMETFNMSQSRGFSTKGTVHVIVNNQIGFTTSDQQDARSTLYCTDVAKMVNAPIFHVDGDDPESVLFVTQIALDYRMMFRKDVIIDLVCYRRHGHSEADEPMATQPSMYRRIRDKVSSPTLYARRLVEAGEIPVDEPGRMREAYLSALEVGEVVARDVIPHSRAYYKYASNWHRFVDADWRKKVDTSVPMDTLRDLAHRLVELPQGFELHPTVAKITDNRRKMAVGALPVDWGFGETMAYATLLKDGYGVRLSGQDSGRGTFFHRHAVLYNQVNGESYIPLRNLSDTQANFLVINSLLSEEAVLAFEYGFATTDPDTLTIWEAQFGDFANNAQVVIDQFISAGEQKWTRLTGLVMFLPHGFEGQGPEHSSARPERYLQLCAEYNMQVCVPTTPAQIFHLLRRQIMRASRKPLVVMTPKSLLRHRLATSTLDDVTSGAFQEVIPEFDELDDSKVRRVVLCSGKVYYDLLDKRRADGRVDVAIIRIEQLYPFPEEELAAQLARYPRAKVFIWCQEEPKNQGAWYTSQHHMRNAIGERGPLYYAGRALSAAPAVGYPARHLEQQHQLVKDALGNDTHVKAKPKREKA